MNPQACAQIVRNMKYALTLIVGLLAQPALAEPIVVFAAASLKAPIDALAAEVGDVVVSFGGSGTLARQVQAGAPVDVILLANEAWMDELAGQVHNVADFASNSLVVIGAADAPDVALEDINLALGDGRLAIGAVASVPAGIYAKAGLEALGLWGNLQDRLVEVDNVRSAVVLVARGEVPFAVTYATDTSASDAVRIVATFPPDSYPSIRYVGGVVSDDPRAAAFWQKLQGSQGQAALTNAGFAQVAK